MTFQVGKIFFFFFCKIARSKNCKDIKLIKLQICLIARRSDCKCISKESLQNSNMVQLGVNSQHVEGEGGQKKIHRVHLGNFSEWGEGGQESSQVNKKGVKMPKNTN